MTTIISHQPFGLILREVLLAQGKAAQAFRNLLKQAIMG
jgi:hypothetical protein